MLAVLFTLVGSLAVSHHGRDLEGFCLDGCSGFVLGGVCLFPSWLRRRPKHFEMGSFLHLLPICRNCEGASSCSFLLRFFVLFAVARQRKRAGEEPTRAFLAEHPVGHTC